MGTDRWKRVRRRLGWLKALQLTTLVRTHDPIRVVAVFSLVNGTLSIGLLAVVAYITASPFIFPSLGPTAFLLFYQPKAGASSPRSTLLGHLIGATVGWTCLAAFGLLDAAPALGGTVGLGHIGAAALSLGGTSALMVLSGAIHPPAGATTLIVSLGLMPHLWQIGVLMVAVFLLLALAFSINRLAGIRYPFWRPYEARDETGTKGSGNRER